MFKCLTCGQKFTNEGALYAHIEKDHKDSIPKNFSPTQYQYMLRTGKERGRCVECGAETKWNETTQKYLRMCGRQLCKDKATKRMRERMVGKYGVSSLLSNPEHQKKMLANRSISGEYDYKGTKIPYTGSYEKSFLEFMDVILNHPADDIIAPSPNTYYYMYKGEKKFYIPDFFIPSLNLEIEVKDGGSNPNNHHKIQAVDKVKEKLKDDVMKSLKNTSYIKIMDKNNYRYVDFLVIARNNYERDGELKPVYLIEDKSSELIPHDANIKDVSESVIAAYNSNDVSVIESTIDMLYENSNVFETGVIIATLENHLETLLEEEEDDYDSGLMEDNLTAEMLMGIRESVEKNDIIKSEGPTEAEVKRQAEVIMDDSFKKVDETINKNKKSVTESTNETLYPVYVLLTNTGTLLSSVISMATDTEFAHSSISFDSSMENLYSFGRKYTNNPLVGRFVSESITQGLYAKKDNVKYALYVTFVNKDSFDSMKERVNYFDKNKESFKYNFRGLLRFKLGKKSDNVNSYFCSQFVDSILREGGEFFEGKHSSEVQPEDFKNNHKFMLVSSGTLSTFDKKKAEANTELLRKNFYSDKLPFKKPMAVYMPINNGMVSGTRMSDLLFAFSENKQDVVYLTLPTNLKTLREITNSTSKTDEGYKKYTVIPINSNVELVDYAEDSATISITPSYKIDNINNL